MDKYKSVANLRIPDSRMQKYTNVIIEALESAGFNICEVDQFNDEFIIMKQEDFGKSKYAELLEKD